MRIGPNASRFTLARPLKKAYLRPRALSSDTSGFQRATAHLSGRGEAVPMNLRVTELFRREGDAWKLVHRHADFLVSEAQKDIK
jgi:ketosteroid isomerase-like protein